MPVLQGELDDLLQHWNTHHIRKSKNPNSPSGVPDVLYLLPQVRSGRDYKVPVTGEDVEIAEETCTERPLARVCRKEFNELPIMVMEDNHLEDARNANEALNLYLTILSHLNNL